MTVLTVDYGKIQSAAVGAVCHTAAAHKSDETAGKNAFAAHIDFRRAVIERATPGNGSDSAEETTRKSHIARKNYIYVFDRTVGESLGKSAETALSKLCIEVVFNGDVFDGTVFHRFKESVAAGRYKPTFVAFYCDRVSLSVQCIVAHFCTGIEKIIVRVQSQVVLQRCRLALLGFVERLAETFHIRHRKPTATRQDVAPCQASHCPEHKNGN